jgi:hypothetical protein
VLFAGARLPFTLSSEQFWGRAARASVTRKSPGARYLCGILRSRNCQPEIKRRRLGRRLRGIYTRYFVEIVKSTVIGTWVSTGCPSSR